MNHAQSLLVALAHVEAAMNSESTVAELAPHVTRDQAALLADAADWLREIVAARPPITQAREWRTPTEHVKALAARIGEGRAVVGRKPASFFPKRGRTR